VSQAIFLAVARLFSPHCVRHTGLMRGRTIWIGDAHRGDGKRFVVRVDEKLTVFLELESAIRAGGKLS
jgi:hypothetical protein